MLAAPVFLLQTDPSQEVPHCPSCVALCAVFAGRVRKQPFAPMPTPVWAVFAERLGGQNFFEPVWVSQARETKILYTNQPNLTSSTACPKELFYLKTRVTHGVENEAG